MQSKLESMIESTVNIGIGYIVSFVSQIVVFPIFDIHVELETNFYISLWFTAISLLRSYAVRRFFNYKQRIR